MKNIGLVEVNNNSTVHIMHIIESLEFGGAEKVLVHLANMLNERYKVSVCLTKKRGELVNQLAQGISVHFLDTGEGNSIELPKRLTKLLIDGKVDILHSHDWGVYLEAAYAVKRANNTKLIHTVHGQYTYYPQGFRSKIKKSIRHMLERWATKHTHKIIAVSDSIRQYILKDIRIDSSKVERIHNGIADLAITSKNQKQSKVDDRTFRIATVGRIAKIKNYPLLINALAVALKEKPNIYLSIVGDGPDASILRELVSQLKMTDHVRFLGFQSNIKEILIKNNAFVLSSDYEGISIAILEAMSLSMPIIATRVGGIPETVINNENGFLVERGDIKHYAEALLKLSGSAKLQASMGEKSRTHFIENFHESVVLSQYMELYQSALSA